MDVFQTKQTLIIRIKNQYDEHSWEEFLEYYRSYIFAVIFNMGISHQEAEDLCQKTLLVLWEKLPEFTYQPEKCKFRTWMTRIIRNVVIKFFQKNKRIKNDITRATLKNINDNADGYDIPEIHEIAEREWQFHISSLAWRNIEKEFSGKAMECFMLFMKGLPVDKVCEILNIKKNSAYVFRSRVQEKLSKEIRRLEAELN